MELLLRLESLTATDAIVPHDFEGNILYVNDSAWKSRGYTREEMLTLNPRDLDTPENIEKIGARMAELGRQGELTFEVAHRRRDGSVIPIEVHTRVVDVYNRKLILGVWRDISQRRQLEEELRQSLQNLISQRFCSTRAIAFWQASNGEEALSIIDEETDHPFDLLLTDVVMPKMGGKELALELKSRQPGMKILFTSGYPNDASILEGVFESEVAYLQKPFTPQVLARRVREVLNS